jgi:hypothetical protein
MSVVPSRSPVEESQEAQRLYEAAHPGHCGKCGLPREICFHTERAYRQDYEEVLSRGSRSKFPFENILAVNRRWYYRSLDRLRLWEIENLPMPPSRPGWLLQELRAYHQRRTAEEAEGRIRGKTFWSTLLSDQVL